MARVTNGDCAQRLYSLGQEVDQLLLLFGVLVEKQV